MLKHEGVAQATGRYRRLTNAQAREHLLRGSLGRRCAPPRDVEVHVGKCHIPSIDVARPIVVEESLQLRARRLLCRDHTLCQKLHFLREVAADDRVVQVEARCDSFTVQHLFSHEILNESPLLLSVRRTFPSGRPRLLQLAELGGRHANPMLCAAEC